MQDNLGEESGWLLGRGGQAQVHERDGMTAVLVVAFSKDRQTEGERVIS